MQLGIFAKTFIRANLAETFSAAKSRGLECVQFNFSCAGLPTLPESIDQKLILQIHFELERNSLFMAAVSGTCNLIHPHLSQRAKNVANLERLIRSAPALGTRIVTLCTGTRDAGDMWRWHPENHLPEAWRDLLDTLSQLLPVAQEYGVFLGIEPEPANVVDSASKARKLLDELRSPSLRVVFDAANLLRPQTLSSQDKILSEAVKILAGDIVLAHAKDLTLDEAGSVAAGLGALNHALYLSLLQNAGFNGPLILHGLSEEEVSEAVLFLQRQLSGLTALTRSTHGSLQSRQP